MGRRKRLCGGVRKNAGCLLSVVRSFVNVSFVTQPRTLQDAGYGWGLKIKDMEGLLYGRDRTLFLFTFIGSRGKYLKRGRYLKEGSRRIVISVFPLYVATHITLELLRKATTPEIENEPPIGERER